MKPAAIILAAGESRRMGRSKAYLPFRGGTFLSVLADTFTVFCQPVVAVFGFDGDRMVQQAPANVQTTINSDYQLGMLSSLQTGLRALRAGQTHDRVLFTLVDHPAIQASTVARLLTSAAPLVIPRWNGKRGHPVLMNAEIARQFLAEPPSAMVRDVVDRNASLIEYVEVDDSGIRDDIDDPALYQALLDRETGVVR